MSDRGSVSRMRIAEIPVRMRAQGPGPVGSAEIGKREIKYFSS